MVSPQQIKGRLPFATPVEYQLNRAEPPCPCCRGNNPGFAACFMLEFIVSGVGRSSGKEKSYSVVWRLGLN